MNCGYFSIWPRDCVLCLARYLVVGHCPSCDSMFFIVRPWLNPDGFRCNTNIIHWMCDDCHKVPLKCEMWRSLWYVVQQFAPLLDYEPWWTTKLQIHHLRTPTNIHMVPYSHQGTLFFCKRHNVLYKRKAQCGSCLMLRCKLN